jgi:hypothetical protein
MYTIMYGPKQLTSAKWSGAKEYQVTVGTVHEPELVREIYSDSSCILHWRGQKAVEE